MNVKEFLLTLAAWLRGRVRRNVAVFQDGQRRPHSVIVLPHGSDLYRVVLDREPFRVGRWNLQLGSERELTVTRNELRPLAKWLVTEFDAGREIGPSRWSAAAWERKTGSKRESSASYLPLDPVT